MRSLILAAFAAATLVTPAKADAYADTWKMGVLSGIKPLRSCQPELGMCVMALFSEDDKTMMRVGTDANGNTIIREICLYNTYRDTRYCSDVDRKTSKTQMKNSSGDWLDVK